MDDVICPDCGQKLGQRVAGLVVLQHKGRTAVTLGLVMVKCDRDGCSGVWRDSAILDVDGYIQAATERLCGLAQPPLSKSQERQLAAIRS